MILTHFTIRKIQNSYGDFNLKNKEEKQNKKTLTSADCQEEKSMQLDYKKQVLGLFCIYLLHFFLHIISKEIIFYLKMLHWPET